MCWNVCSCSFVFNSLVTFCTIYNPEKKNTILIDFCSLYWIQSAASYRIVCLESLLKLNVNLNSTKRFQALKNIKALSVSHFECLMCIFIYIFKWQKLMKLQKLQDLSDSFFFSSLVWPIPSHGWKWANKEHCREGRIPTTAN